MIAGSMLLVVGKLSNKIILCQNDCLQSRLIPKHLYMWLIFIWDQVLFVYLEKFKTIV